MGKLNLLNSTETPMTTTRKKGRSEKGRARNLIWDISQIIIAPKELTRPCPQSEWG